MSKEKLIKPIDSKSYAQAKFIGDLPTYHYTVDLHTSVEEVTEKFKKHPKYPGVILQKGERFYGTLSRLKIFEYLGRPYGVELFFKKPIKNLYNNLNSTAEIYPENMKIGAAVQQALNRPPEIRYEPLVVSFEESGLRLLDMNILLLAQSEQLASANRLIEKQIEIGKILSSSLELPKVLALVLEQMESIIPFDRAAILLNQNGELEFAASHGYPPDVNMDEARLLINNNKIFSSVIESRRPLIIEDASLHPDWRHIPGTPPTHSWMGVPLLQNDKVLGLFSVSRLVTAPFTPGEVETSSIFAGHAAIALGNAHLFDEVQKFNQELENQRESLQKAVEELNHANLSLTRRAMQLETSNKIGQQVTSILEIKQLLPQVMNTIQSKFNYSWVSVWMMNESKNLLVLEAGTKASVKLGTSLPVDHKGLAAQAIRSGEVTLENNIGYDNNFVSTPGLSNVYSEIALPLKFHNDAMGVLDIQSERIQAYNPEDIAVLQIAAAQIAIAIRNARSYSELIRINDELKISQMAGSKVNSDQMAG